MRSTKDIIIEGMSLDEHLRLHKLWLRDELGGIRLYLCGANLHSADLRGADIEYANLHSADLRGADLQYANLQYANLCDADLQDADLQYANLKYANLCDAGLHDANLRGAVLDFSQLNLSCRALNFKIDERIAKQLMYHVVNLMQHSDLDVNKWVKKQTFKDLETSHLVKTHKLPILKGKKI